MQGALRITLTLPLKAHFILFLPFKGPAYKILQRLCCTLLCEVLPLLVVHLDSTCCCKSLIFIGDHAIIIFAEIFSH